MNTLNACPDIRLERLLLCTDGSEFSEGAVREAISIAKRCNSKLYVISVVEINPELEAYAPGLVETIEKDTGRDLEGIKERAEKEGVTCETITHKGEEPYRYIVKEASGLKADLIIMGRRGRTDINRLMMGSVTARVIGHTACNVLVVPRSAVFKCKKILIATDGSEFSSKAVHDALDIATACESEVVIVSVASNESEVREAEGLVREACKMAGEKGIKVTTGTPVGTVYEMIIDLAEKENIDLIVVGSHGKTGLKRLLMGSVAERVIGHASCTVLVVK
ncbi:MAG TPA: universal stress protein [Nitrospirae bacterium]|nr:universal stress protein [Nitrospirota bacterium]